MRVVAAGVVAGVLVGTTVIGPVGGPIGVAPTHAQPAPGSAAAPGPPAPDLVRAKDLYGNAERAMAEARYADAIRDYGEAYEITRDPVLFYKIASANEKAGTCGVALTYYRRYLKEAAPTEEFVAKTRERIVACGGTVEPASGAEDTDPVPGTTGAPTADRGVPPGAGSAAPVTSGEPAGEPPAPASGDPAGADPGDAPATAPPAPAATPNPLGRDRGAWLLIGGAVGLVTIGAVLAYSANAAESDLADLYVGLEGRPPVFDARTQDRYDDLISEGERYEKLSWVSFGIAGALGLGAAILFATGHRATAATAESTTVRITPTVKRDGGGISALFRF